MTNNNQFIPIIIYRDDGSSSFVLEQGTSLTLTSLTSATRYRIAVCIVTSSAQSPYSPDQIITTNRLQASELDLLSDSLDMPFLEGSAATLTTKAFDLATRAAAVETAIGANSGDIYM